MGSEEQKVKKVIVVDTTRQTVDAFEGSRVMFHFDAVTGDREHPTNRGKFQILRKNREHRSSKYNAQMNYSLFFTRDGKALHQYHGPLPIWALKTARQNVTDAVGSHGCVRLDEKNARSLFDWAEIGTLVEVK